MVGIGSIVGSYRITDKIGEGGMGAVYKGVDQMLEREVAIKMLRPELARQPDVLERFRSEAVTLAKLNHPNIATLYNFLQHEGDYFMVMEFVPGNTIENIIIKFGAIAYERAIPLFCQALEGIDQAHRKGIIHRDIKPANVMVLDAGAVKVMDFGIARMLGSARLTKQGNVVGTVEYMSPESIRGEDVDARSDIYSLGILLYEMLTGRLPFENTSEYELMRSQIEDAPPPPTAYLPNIPVAIEQAIMRSLAKRREARFQTAGEFRASLLSSLVASVSETGNITANYAAPATRVVEALPNSLTADNLKGGAQVVNRNTQNPSSPITESQLPPTQKINLPSSSQELPSPAPPETLMMGGNQRAQISEPGTLILGDKPSQSIPAPVTRTADIPSLPMPPAPPFAPPVSASPTIQQTQRLPGESQMQQPTGTQIISGQSGQMQQPPAFRDSRDSYPPMVQQMPPPATSKSNWKIFAGVGVLILVLAAAAAAFFISKNRNAAAPAPVQVEETNAAPTEENPTPPTTDSQPVNAATADSLANSATSTEEAKEEANANASTNPNAAKQRSRKDDKTTNTSGEETKQAEVKPEPTPPPAETKPQPPQPETKPEPTKTEPSAATTETKTAEKPKKRGIFKRIFGIGADDEKKKKEEEKKKEQKKNP